MRKPLSFLAPVAALIVLPILLGGWGSGSQARYQEEIVIGWTPPDITGVFKTATDFFEKGAADANKHGFKVKVLSRAPSSHTAFADQIAIVEDFISKNVDVIAISPADTEALKPAIREANKAGIPVIMVNLLERQKNVKIASYIGFDNSDAASVSAYALLDYYGGPGVLGSGPKVKVKPSQYLDLAWWKRLYKNADKSKIKASGVIIEGIAGTFFSQERVNGFHKVVDQYPGIKILGKPIAADWNREKGIKATETFTSRYSPSEMNFIWAASNEMGLGAMLTLDRKGILDKTGGKTPPAAGKVAVFTNDVTPESVARIKEGKIIAETTHGFADWGWYGTKFAVILACGEKVPAKFDIRPRTVWQGNAGLFFPRPALPKIDWAKIKAGCR
jgi:ribose transport system substrate-binding protein